MGAIRYDVVAVGDGDLSHGLGFLLAQVEESGLPAVSANLVYKHSGEPVFPPYLILKRGGLRIGVTAISGGPESLRGGRRNMRNQNFALADPGTSLNCTIAKMREKEKVDIVIAVSHLGESTNQLWEAGSPHVDLVIDAHPGGRYITPENQSGTVLAGCRGGAAEYGELHLSLDNQRAIQTFSGQGKTLTREGRSDETVARILGEFKQSMGRSSGRGGRD